MRAEQLSVLVRRSPGEVCVVCPAVKHLINAYSGDDLCEDASVSVMRRMLHIKTRALYEVLDLTRTIT